MAIRLYESYVFRVGTLIAISLASTLIFFLGSDDELLWSYSGLLIGTAYFIAAASSFNRFHPDIITGRYSSGGPVAQYKTGAPADNTSTIFLSLIHI